MLGLPMALTNLPLPEREIVAPAAVPAGSRNSCQFCGRGGRGTRSRRSRYARADADESLLLQGGGVCPPTVADVPRDLHVGVGIASVADDGAPEAAPVGAGPHAITICLVPAPLLALARLARGRARNQLLLALGAEALRERVGVPLGLERVEGDRDRGRHRGGGKRAMPPPDGADQGCRASIACVMRLSSGCPGTRKNTPSKTQNDSPPQREPRSGHGAAIPFERISERASPVRAPSPRGSCAPTQATRTLDAPTSSIGRNLAKGQTGLSITAFDLPTQTGYDPDHVLARGEVGKVGVSIVNKKDMHQLLDGIPLGEMNTSMTINATAAWLLALYVTVAEENEVDRAAPRRDDPERHHQGVPGPRHLRLPARPLDAPDRRHGRVHGQRDPEVEPDQCLQLPPAGGRERRRSRRSPTPSPPRSPSWTRSRRAARSPTRISPRSSAGSASSSTPASGSSRSTRSSAP